MANNYDIRCGLIMDIKLNKNYVEWMLIDGYELHFDDGNYRNANESTIDLFWRDVNRRFNHSFCIEECQEFSVGSELFEIVMELSEEYNFNFEREYMSNNYDYYDEADIKKMCDRFKITRKQYDDVINGICTNFHCGGVYGCDICLGGVDEDELCEEGMEYCPIYHAFKDNLKPKKKRKKLRIIKKSN